MNFETKAIHGVRTPEKGIENWGSTLNLATTFPIKTYLVIDKIFLLLSLFL